LLRWLHSSIHLLPGTQTFAPWPLLEATRPDVLYRSGALVGGIYWLFASGRGFSPSRTMAGRCLEKMGLYVLGQVDLHWCSASGADSTLADIGSLVVNGTLLRPRRVQHLRFAKHIRKNKSFKVEPFRNREHGGDLWARCMDGSTSGALRALCKGMAVTCSQVRWSSFDEYALAGMNGYMGYTRL